MYKKSYNKVHILRSWKINVTKSGKRDLKWDMELLISLKAEFNRVQNETNCKEIG